MYGEYKEEPSH